MSKRLSRSLNAQLLLSQLIAVLSAAAVFLGVFYAGNYTVEHFYMSSANVSSRKAAIYAEFAAYVRAGQFSGQNEAAVAAFNRAHRYATVTVYPAGTPGSTLNAARSGKLYPMTFPDGAYSITIIDSSDSHEKAINAVLATVSGVVVFTVIQLSYAGKLTRRILALSRKAALVSAGEIDTPITAEGSDEIAALANDIDTMRRSVIERLGSEKRAWEANSELITAMSHDIRTPMTSLLGYLELLNGGGLDERQRTQLTASAYGKARELKDLTDELFRYFLVFGNTELQLDKQPYDAPMLLEQLLGEAAFELQDQGFTVQQPPFTESCSVTTDPMYLKRVVDNLVSNIRKYADPARPVVMLAERRGNELTVVFSNAVRRGGSRVESSKIGVRTCEKLMQVMGGRFTVTSDADHYAAEFALPVE